MYGRIFLGILEAVALGVVVAIWSALTRANLASDQVIGFAILATAVRETLDAASMRLTMRVQRTDDMSATQRIVAAVICPVIGGVLAAAIFTPLSPAHPTLLTWALFMLITCTLEKPWKTSMSYEEMRQRNGRTRLMTREHFAEEIAEGRISLRPIDDEGYYLDEEGNRLQEDRPVGRRRLG